MAETGTKLAYPGFRWPNSGWWFTVIGALAGLAVLAFPGLLQLTGRQRLAVCAVLIVVPACIIVSYHCARCVRVFIRRALQYERLRELIVSLNTRQEAGDRLCNALLQERENRNAFEVAYCYAFGDRTFIALRTKRGPGRSAGAEVRVTDRESGALMGVFRLTRKCDGHYLCELVGYMDALWLGNVKKHGSQHSEPPPEAIAWILSTTDGDSDEQLEEDC